MSNMSYCRFRNTLDDLYACNEAMNNNDCGASDIEDEEAARKSLIKLCARIAESYGSEVNLDITVEKTRMRPHHEHRRLTR